MGMGRCWWGPDPLSPPEKDDFHPRTDTDPTTNCVNNCRDDGNCRGSRKCCHIRCPFRCPQPVPGKGSRGSGLGTMAGTFPMGMSPSPSPSAARPDTYPKKKVPHIIGCCNSTCSSDTDFPNHLRCCQPMRRSSRITVALSLLDLGCWWCSDPEKLCRLIPEHRLCRGRAYCYACIPALRSCRVFVHSSCGGNANNFRTLAECQQVCQHGESWARVGAQSRVKDAQGSTVCAWGKQPVLLGLPLSGLPGALPHRAVLRWPGSSSHGCSAAVHVGATRGLEAFLLGDSNQRTAPSWELGLSSA